MRTSFDIPYKKYIFENHALHKGQKDAYDFGGKMMWGGGGAGRRDRGTGRRAVAPG